MEEANRPVWDPIVAITDQMSAVSLATRLVTSGYRTGTLVSHFFFCESFLICSSWAFLDSRRENSSVQIPTTISETNTAAITAESAIVDIIGSLFQTSDCN